MAAPDKILKLVKKFEDNYESYLSGGYNEAQVRADFINPFFEALGWDVRNEDGLAEAYRDVVHEESIEVGSGLKAPDMTFRIGGTRKFFVECKKPSIDLKKDTRPAYQLRRYGWNAKLPLSILTDFEEFVVYDCRTRPKKSDKSSIARTEYFKYTEYADRWDEIAAVFSKEAVLKGSFDRFAEKKKKRGTVEVDDAFLEEIEHWRETLAKNIALRNKIADRELNYAVQQTIDRIIFLRICEDRGIEPYQGLGAVSNGAGIYDRLKQLFVKADQRYNSGLFHFRKEKGRDESPDELTPRLKIDDKVLKDIIRGLYYPESPYAFSVMPADILGQVYERFLGKVIRLTAGHHAKVEEKPEVRKAGGVYYTPTYIVDYIVKNTVGKLLEGKTPKKVEKLRILDPACGSGSFLIGAYQHLLDWHLKWYLDHDPKKHKKALYQVKKNEWRLTTAERKRILLNNIYGVDIDSQAVEVTKLSLLLKVLEGENKQTLDRQMKLFHERALPDLGNNIKCGNSLIGPDFYDGKQMSLLGDDERRSINTFDWNAEFSEVMTVGGFDAVIGNPPYVRQELLNNAKDYFEHRFKVYHGAADLYTYFIEKGISLLKQNGLFGIIVANKWMRANYGAPLRRWLKRNRIEEILDFGDLPVFQGATTYPCIIVIRRASPVATFKAANIDSLAFASLTDHVQDISFLINQVDLGDERWSLSDKRTRDLFNDIMLKGIPLGQYVSGRIYRGVLTGLNEAFIIGPEIKSELLKKDKKCAQIIKPFLMGRDLKRYKTPKIERHFIFTRRGIDIKKYPAIEEYLLQFKERLMPKPKGWKGSSWKGRKPGSYKWYEIQDTIEYYAEFEKPKIIVPAIVKQASYIFDDSSFYSNDKTTIISTDDLYLLGLLNSKTVDFIMHSIASTKQGGYYEYKPMYLEQLPIREVAHTDTAACVQRDKIRHLVKDIISLHGKADNSGTPHEMEALQRQIAATDRQIDQLVYELYGLTEEEIRIVEESVNR